MNVSKLLSIVRKLKILNVRCALPARNGTRAARDASLRVISSSASGRLADQAPYLEPLGRSSPAFLSLFLTVTVIFSATLRLCSTRNMSGSEYGLWRERAYLKDPSSQSTSSSSRRLPLRNRSSSTPTMSMPTVRRTLLCLISTMSNLFIPRRPGQGPLGQQASSKGASLVPV